MPKHETQGGTLKGHGRTLRIDPYGDLWTVTEGTKIDAEYTDGDTDEFDAVEVLGHYATKSAAIAAARRMI